MEEVLVSKQGVGSRFADWVAETRGAVLSFSRTFWASIVNEVFERGAWYGLFSLITLYLTGPISEGALGLPHELKGTILAVVPFFVYFVPIFSGTIGDKIGYKKVLLASFAILAAGYYSLSWASGYYSFFGFFLLVALGAGIFKPMVTSTVMRDTCDSKSKRSIGTGIFYMTVNVGGFIGPIISGMVRPSVAADGAITGSWQYVFYLSAAYMVIMFFWTLFMYKELKRGKDESQKPLSAKLREMVTDLKDLRLAALLLIFVGFWAMFQQLFITLPSWIEEWTNTSWLAAHLPSSWVTHGQVKAEYLTNLDAFAIIFFNVIIAAVVQRFNVLKTISVGTLVAAAGLMSFYFASTIIGGGAGEWILLIGIFVFAVGEMMSSPKFTELMGNIAPEDKIGTYQGYGYLSVAGGFFLGGKLSALYGVFADKATMYREELINQFGMNKTALEKLGSFDLGAILQAKGVDLSALDQQLWNTHHPYVIWFIYGVIGVATVLALWFYRRRVPQIGVNASSES